MLAKAPRHERNMQTVFFILFFCYQHLIFEDHRPRLGGAPLYFFSPVQRLRFISTFQSFVFLTLVFFLTSTGTGITQLTIPSVAPKSATSFCLAFVTSLFNS